jgi:hypothetical protein
LSDAQLQGADLFGAQLQGANLANAQLQGADLRNARLWNATGHAAVGLADLRRIDARTPLPADARATLERALAAIPAQADRDLVAARVWDRSANPDEAPDLVLSSTAAQPALVSDNADAVLTPVDVTNKADPAFVNLLVGYLLDDLARSNPAITGGLARRAAHALSQDATDVVALALACRLPADAVRSTIVNEPRLNLFYSTKAALGALAHCSP